jgi:primosomal protein N' (replication factor Y)
VTEGRRQAPLLPGLGGVAEAPPGPAPQAGSPAPQAGSAADARRAAHAERAPRAARAAPVSSEAESTTAADAAGACLVEVALPVPLRRRFTYRAAPDLAARLRLGQRVAVPFGPRKLPGIVVALDVPPPEGTARLRDIADVLDDEPVFPEELLAFLREAAEYYLHPLGEVLRAAAPALPREALARLRREGFLGRGETLPGSAIAVRTETWVRRTALSAEGVRLGPKQRALLAIVEARAEVGMDELRRHLGEPRAVARALVKRGLLALEERAVAADPFFATSVERDVAPVPSEAQRQAVDAIAAAVRAGGYHGFLLHGVTGSGKTEVYLRAIAEARARGKGAILLVPEIALTPQLVGRFRARFGDALAVLHSDLGDRERHEAWRALRSGAVTLAVGARSAIFAPVADLGVIVVDEEHDPSFKQEEGFRYHARDLALLRAHRAGAVCVLGSATPSVETFHLAERGRLTLLALPERATPRPLPLVEIVDLARHRGTPSGHPLLSAPLHRALERCLGAGGQAIVFLNRRGFSPSLRCASCGEVATCPACSVALTEHKRAGVLRCHYCDFTAPVTDVCGACGAKALEPLGLGTEKLEEAIAQTFAPARVARLDRDTAAGGEGVEAMLDRVRRREVDVLVGTQMVTKGHDLPGVTLVGVILADQSLAFPDFRAAERTFQLLAQVAGRAGRGQDEGVVVLQTFQPDHPAVVHASRHDYHAFYAAELEARRDLGYAPFSRLVAVRVDAGDEAVAERAAGDLAALARAHPAVRAGSVRVLGPAPAPIARLRGRWRWRLLLRSADRAALRAVAAAVAARIDDGLGAARASVDVDPVQML